MSQEDLGHYTTIDFTDTPVVLRSEEQDAFGNDNPNQGELFDISSDIRAKLRRQFEEADKPQDLVVRADSAMLTEPPIIQSGPLTVGEANPPLPPPPPQPTEVLLIIPDHGIYPINIGSSIGNGHVLPTTPNTSTELVPLINPGIQINTESTDTVEDDDYSATMLPSRFWLGRLGARTLGLELPPQSIGERVKANEARIVKLEREVRPDGVIAAVMNTKGTAGKTTVTAYCAALASEVTNANILIGDVNPTGVIGARFGVGIKGGPSKLTMKSLSREVQALVRLEGDQQKLSADAIKHIRTLIPSARYGVRVISANPSYDQTDRINGTDIKRVLGAVDILADHQFYDMGNVLNNSVVLNTLDRTNVFIFTANVAVPATLRQLETSMQELRNLADGRYAERVDRGIVVLNGLRRGQYIEDFNEYLYNLNEAGEVTDDSSFQGCVVGIPYTETLTGDDEALVDLKLLKPKGLGKTNLKPFEAYQQLVIAILEERKRQINNQYQSQ